MKKEGICRWKGCTQKAETGRVLCAEHLPDRPTVEEAAARFVKRYLRLLRVDKISPEEFADSVLLRCIDTQESWWRAIAEAMPPHVEGMCRDHICSFIIAADYMPKPTFFMVGNPTDEEIEQKKREMRPAYVALHKFWRARGDSS